MTVPQNVTPLAELFAGVVAPRPRKGKDGKEIERATVEDSDYLLMMWRMVRALEARAISNPEMLPQVVALAQRLSEVVNVSIAVNADRYAVNPFSGASMAECARALGISKQSASERRRLGNQVMLQRVEAAGAVKFSEARRERQAIEQAAEHAAASLIEYRARHRQAS